MRSYYRMYNVHTIHKFQVSNTFELLFVGLKFKTIQMKLLWFLFISLAWFRCFGQRQYKTWHPQHEYRFDNEEKHRN